jgi:predicted nucleic acid-binding protein
MVLVDTSVLIGYLRGTASEAADSLDDLESHSVPWGISAFTYQEVLQGAANEKELKVLREYLDTQTIYFLQGGKYSHADAARLFFRCRKSGYTVRSIIDCLIAQTAIEHNLRLLHQDRDFAALGKVEPKLKFL